MGPKIRIGAVSYLNTRPLVHGFEQGLGSGRSPRAQLGLGKPDAAG